MKPVLDGEMIGRVLGATDEDKRAASLIRVLPPPSSLVGNLPCCLIPWKLEGEVRILSGMSERERSLRSREQEREQRKLKSVQREPIKKQPLRDDSPGDVDEFGSSDERRTFWKRTK